MRSFKWHYMSFEGRIGRKQYWLMYFLPALLVGIIIEVFSPDLEQSDNIVTGILMGLLYIPILCSMFCGYVKRQHDLGRSGWWTLLAFIPLIGFFYNLIYLGCFRGNDGVNDYGEPAVPSKQSDD